MNPHHPATRSLNFPMTLLWAVGLCLLAPVSPAGATYPGPEISFWNDKLSHEAEDPDYQKVRSLVKEEEYDAALALLEKKINATGHKATPLILKGLVLDEMGRYKQALTTLRKGADLEMRHPALNFAYCQVYRHMGQAELSDRACKIAKMQYPDNPLPYYESAKTLEAMGKMIAANRELQIAAGLDPGNPLYPFEMGMNYFYLNQWDAVEKSFQKVLALNPRDLRATYQLGYLYAIRNQKDKARFYLLRVLESGKNDPNVDSAKSLLEYINKDALDKLPKKNVPYEYHLKRSRAMYQSRKYGLSLIEIETAARLKPGDLKIQEILVGMYSILLRLNPTETAVRKLIEIGKNDNLLKARAYQELGDIMVIRGRMDDARKYYERSRGLGDPNNLSEISLAELPGENPGKLYPLDSNDILIDPAEGLNRKGEIFAYHGMFNRAIAIYSMVLRMAPNHLMAKLNLATAYFNTKKYGRTISILEKILVNDPGHEHILAHRLLLAEAYVKKGDIEPGIENLRLVLQLNPGMKKAIQTNPVFDRLKDNGTYQELFH